MSILFDQKRQPPSGIVTLLTDFGTVDGFVGAMKGVILDIYRRAQIVDLTHEMAPQNILGGAFLLSAHFKYFAPGTVHVAVVDPGVGTARKAIACYAREHYFVAPDNGLLDFCAQDDGCVAVELTRREYWLPRISNTFHGRDVFAPVAAHLAADVALLEFGERIQLAPRLHDLYCRVDGEVLCGSIIHVDRFGNLISNITKTAFDAFVAQQPFVIHFEKSRFTEITPTYGYAEPGAHIALFNSFDCLEIALVRGAAQADLPGALRAAVIIKRGT